MKMFRGVTAVAAAALMLGGGGCFRSTKLVRPTQAPEVYRTTSAEFLEQQICERDKAIQSLRANVLLTAKVGGGRTGKETTYTSTKGYIFLNKPDSLRVILQLPILGSRLLDMVSKDGQFLLVYNIPGKGEFWKKGSNVVTSPSKNGLENLRPPVFFDSMLTPCVTPDQYVSLNESTRILPAPDKKRVDIEEPDYDMVISKANQGHVLKTVRVVHISRVTMLPFEQEIYNDKGEVETRATYDKYQKFGDIDFPMLITMERPIDQYQLKVEITKLTPNEKFDADQFVLKVPDGVKVQEMK